MKKVSIQDIRGSSRFTLIFSILTLGPQPISLDLDQLKWVSIGIALISRQWRLISMRFAKHTFCKLMDQMDIQQLVN